MPYVEKYLCKDSIHFQNFCEHSKKYVYLNSKYFKFLKKLHEIVDETKYCLPIYVPWSFFQCLKIYRWKIPTMTTEHR